MGKKVLVVEDSASIRALITTTLEDFDDFEVVEAQTGFEALKILPTQEFDLILTDINMPDINGLEVLNFVKKSNQFKKIPLIIVTTEKGEEDRKKGIAMGAQEYIVKPFDPEELKSIVRRILKI